MELNCELAIVRSWRPKDRESLARHANNPKIAEYLRDIFPHPYGLDAAKQWIDLCSCQIPEVNFAIDVDGKAVGGIGIILQSDIYRKNAEIGYWLGEAYWGQGIMTPVLKSMVKYTFQNFDLERIFAGIIQHNHASMRVLEKAGFVSEAIIKKGIVKNGKLYGEHIYSIHR